MRRAITFLFFLFFLCGYFVLITTIYEKKRTITPLEKEEMIEVRDSQIIEKVEEKVIPPSSPEPQPIIKEEKPPEAPEPPPEKNNRVLDVTATHYIAMCQTGCIGITKTGIDVRNTIKTKKGYGIIAVDPNVIPLHSIVSIDGKLYKAEDTGGAIKGHKIDILVESREKAIQLGRVKKEVEIIREGKGEQ